MMHSLKVRGTGIKGTLGSKSYKNKSSSQHWLLFCSYDTFKLDSGSYDSPRLDVRVCLYHFRQLVRFGVYLVRVSQLLKVVHAQFVDQTSAQRVAHDVYGRPEPITKTIDTYMHILTMLGNAAGPAFAPNIYNSCSEIAEVIEKADVGLGIISMLVLIY